MADYNPAPQIQDANTCILYGKVYRLRQQGNMPPVQVTQSSIYPAKLVLGDFGRNDNPLISTYTVEDLRGGMGLYRYRANVEQSELDRYWTSSNMNTLWGNVITLAPAAAALGADPGATIYGPTAIGSRSSIPLIVWDSTVYRWQSSAWTSLGGLTGNPTGIPVSFAGRLYFPQGQNGYSYSPDTTSAPTNLTDITPQSMVVWDNRIWALGIASSGTFPFYSSTTGNNASWTTQAALQIDATVDYPFGELKVFFDAAGNPAIWAITHAGAYIFDPVNNKWFKSTFDVPYYRYPFNFSRSTSAVFRSKLYETIDLRTVVQLELGQGLVVSDVSPLRPDGVAAAMQGALGAFAADQQLLFALMSAFSYPNPTSLAPSLLIFNERGWHCIWRGTSTNTQRTAATGIINNSDGYFIYFSDYVGAAWLLRRLDLYALETNPLVAAGVTYATQGKLETPWFDGGYEAQQKLALQVRVKVQGMVTGSETAMLEYATDFDETSYQTLGTISRTSFSPAAAAGEFTYRFPYNGASAGYVGTSFKSLKWRLTLNSAGAGNAPKVEYIALDFLRIPQILRGFQITIDCNEDSPDGRTPQQQIDDLWTAISTTTMGTFGYRDDQGNTRSYMVKVMRPQGAEQTGEDNRGMYSLYLPVFGGNS